MNLRDDEIARYPMGIAALPPALSSFGSSHVALSRPEASIANAAREYASADQLWHRATDALLAGDYDEFDRLMREFRNISDKWRKK